MSEPKPIASLEPGKLYVIKTTRQFSSEENVERFRQDLQRQAPECKFLILGPGFEIVGATHHCKDCKHYSPPSRESLGICVIATTSYGIPDHPDSMAYAIDVHPRHFAELRVSPDFGCVQFEPKEQQ